jgi:hypothetical protein
MSHIRGKFWAGLLTLILLIGVSRGAFAQPDAQQPNPQAPARPPIVEVTKSYTFDGILFVLLMGGALYAVCRSSNRR